MVRGVAWTGAVLAGLVILVGFGLPLLLRGPVLVALVERQAADRCGTVELEGGHLGLAVVPALLFQRPFDLALDGLRVREPEGGELFQAAEVRARLRILRRPWRVIVERMAVSDGAWRLINAVPGRPVTVALRKLPPEGRAYCRARKPPVPPGAERRPAGAPLVARAVTLRNVTVTLAFPVWAVTLRSTDARGTLELRVTDDDTQVLFDVREVEAKRGGSLRVGRASSRLDTTVPFDRVVIPRVAVTTDQPQDLLLEVQEARSGPAVLAGRAVFTDVFAPTPRRVPAGMQLEARWTEVGRALAGNLALAGLGRRLAGLGAGVRTSLHGPFGALTGSAQIAGRGLSLDARLLPERRYRLALALDQLDTGPLLTPGQRRLLGGRLDGRLALTARLGRAAKDAVISLDSVELVLRRHRASRGRQPEALPRRLVVSRTLRPAAPEELRLGLGAVTLEGEQLRVDPLSVSGPGLSVTGGLRAGREGSSRRLSLCAWTGPGSLVTWRGETFSPPGRLQARLDPSRELIVEPFSVAHAGGGTVTLGGTVGLADRAGTRSPPRADARVYVRGYPLGRLPGLAATRPPGQHKPMRDLLRGRLDARLDLTGPLDQPALAGLLTLGDVRWAGQRLGNGRVDFTAVPGGTRFAGRLLNGASVHGRLGRKPGPGHFAALTLREVDLAPYLPPPARRLALRTSGAVVWRPGDAAAPTTTTADLTTRGTGITLAATARLEARNYTGTVRGRVALARIPAALPALRLRRATGLLTTDLRWQARQAHGIERIDGDVTVAERLVLWAVGAPAAIVVPRTRVQLRGDEVRVPGLAVVTHGARVTLAGSMAMDWARPGNSGLDGTLRASLDGRGLGPWLPGRGTGAGSAELRGRLTGRLRAPLVHGRAAFRALTLAWPRSPVGALRVDGPIAVRGRAMQVGPLRVRLESGGWLQIAGPDGPGRLVIAPGAPLPVQEVDLVVHGAGLTTARPLAGLTVRDLALALRIADQGGQRIRIAGQVQLGHGRYQLGTRRRREPEDEPPRDRGSGPNLWARLADRVWLEVGLRGPREAVTVGIPFAPDVTLGLRCYVRGPLTAPRVEGQVRGSGLYSGAALTVADWLSSRALRDCDLGPH